MHRTVGKGAYGTYHVCVAIYFSDKYVPTNRQFAYNDNMNIVLLRASILRNEASQSHFFVLPTFPTYTLAPPGKKNRWANSIAAHFTRKHAPPSSRCFASATCVQFSSPSSAAAAEAASPRSRARKNDESTKTNLID